MEPANRPDLTWHPVWSGCPAGLGSCWFVGLRLRAGGRGQWDDLGGPDLLVAFGLAGEHDDLGTFGQQVEDRAEPGQAGGVAVAERVVDDDGDAVVLVDQCGARQAGTQTELLLRAARQPVER